MIAIISGTNRPESNTRKVAQMVSSLYEDLGAETRLLDLLALPPGLFEGSAYADKPAAFTESFVNPVLEASGLVVVTPEYNGGFPGVLKYFIDMLPFPESFDRKPVAFVGLSAGYYGALRPVEQLQQIFGYRNAHIFPARVFLPSIQKILAGDGTIADEDLLKRLKNQASDYLDFIKALQE